MTRRIRRTAVAVIALVSIGGLPPAQGVESHLSQATARLAPQADERRAECVRERKVSGLPVRSLLCVRVLWDESAGTTTTISRLRVVNDTRSNRSVRIRMTARPGRFRPADTHHHSLAPGSSVTFTEERMVDHYIAHPVARSRVVLYSGETDGYTIAGKTLRATP